MNHTRHSHVLISFVLAFSTRIIFPDPTNIGQSIPSKVQWADCQSEEYSEIIARAWHVCASPGLLQHNDCSEFVADLVQVKEPTPEQRRALAISYLMASSYEASMKKREEMHQYVINTMRALVKEYPDDARWAYGLALVERDEHQKIASFQYALKIDPACIAAAEEIADMLSRSDSEASHAKAREYMLYAYEHGLDKNKLYYARKYIEYINFMHKHPNDVYARNVQRQKAEDSFRSRVIEDMGLDKLSFSEMSRTDSLGLICGEAALAVGIETLCLDAILLLANHDVEAKRPLGTDVLHAVRSVALWILHSPNSHHNHKIEREFGVDARYAMYLRDALDTVPKDNRTPQYYETYGWIVGPERRPHILRLALELDSKNGRIGLGLAEAYMALEQYTEAEAMYQHVIVNNDGQGDLKDSDEESYARIARKRLSDLEEILSGDGE